MILLIDNYDSFVFNLERHFRRLGQETRVLRNDAVDAASVAQLAPRAVVFSPGPCSPTEAGNSLQIAKQLGNQIPMLGVCLGHQILAQAWGASITRAATPMHGRTSEICHDGEGVFRGLPNPLTVCRYHSLVVKPTSMPDCLHVSAKTKDGVLMAFRHKQRPLVGLQFHPEAILTEHGYDMLGSFLTGIGLTSRSVDSERPAAAKAPREHQGHGPSAPDHPITF